MSRSSAVISGNAPKLRFSTSFYRIVRFCRSLFSVSHSVSHSSMSIPDQNRTLDFFYLNIERFTTPMFLSLFCLDSSQLTVEAVFKADYFQVRDDPQETFNLKISWKFDIASQDFWKEVFEVEICRDEAFFINGK